MKTAVEVLTIAFGKLEEKKLHYERILQRVESGVLQRELSKIESRMREVNLLIHRATTLDQNETQSTVGGELKDAA